MTNQNQTRLSIATTDPLDVRKFKVTARMSRLFRAEVEVVSTNLDIDFAGAIGQDARFELMSEWARPSWTGICEEMEQVRVDEAGLATYRVVLVPRLWLLTQRKNYRIFQYLSELEIVAKLLGEWGVAFETRADAAAHKARKYRTQYGETDFAFVSRMLEDCGVNYWFEATDDGTKLILDDAPETREVAHSSLRFHDRPGVTDGAFVTQVGVQARLRPGKLSLGDLDYRRPSYAQPTLDAQAGRSSERALEQFDYEPGAFLYKSEGGGLSPTADDRGAARTDEAMGGTKTKNRLLSARSGAKTVTFVSNVIELAPGAIASVTSHPHPGLDEPLLVLSSSIEGAHADAWRVSIEAAPTSIPRRPERTTPKPRVPGLESATVVGPAGEEIHTDEFGRVRVHFHWDRESKRNEASSCWLPINQPWAGQGFGAVNLPRIGQEVLVEFLGADPDRPVVIGRVYTEENPVPQPLPKFKTVSGFMSEASPRIVMGAADLSTVAAGEGGGTVLSPADIARIVTEDGPFKAQSPTGAAHQWSGSGLLADDWSGRENLYLQANRDLHVIAWNNWTTVVGNHRATMVGTDDVLSVEGDQSIDIGTEQTTDVGADALTDVYGRRTDKVGNRFSQEAKLSITMEATHDKLILRADQGIRFDCDTTIEVRVRNSLVKLGKDEIFFNAGESRIHINPDKS